MFKSHYLPGDLSEVNVIWPVLSELTAIWMVYPEVTDFLMICSELKFIWIAWPEVTVFSMVWTQFTVDCVISSVVIIIWMVWPKVIVLWMVHQRSLLSGRYYQSRYNLDGVSRSQCILDALFRVNIYSDCLTWGQFILDGLIRGHSSSADG